MKIEKLSWPANFIQCRRRFQAIISWKDPAFLRIQIIALQSNTEKLKKLQLFNAKTKSTIVFCLEGTALAKAHKLVEDLSVPAKTLWDEFARIYLAPSTQTVANLQARLEAMSFSEEDDWDKHVSKFSLS